MAPLKRRPPARSQRRTKPRRRKPDIPKLVYKYLQEAANSCLHTSNRYGKHGPEITDTGTMVNRQRKDGAKKPKSRGVKRRRPSKERLSSCVHNCTGAEGLRKVKKYIQEAVDFGVEFGYLRPKNASCNLLRVSSDLMNDRNQRAISTERERSPHRTPTRLEDYQVQDARRRRRRRKRRRRSRSGSRSRRRRSRRRGSRRRSRSANPEEAAENEEDYLEEDGDEKRSANGEDTEKNPESDSRQNQQPDQEKTDGKADEGDSTTSVDEDETDEDEEKKRDEPTKS